MSDKKDNIIACSECFKDAAFKYMISLYGGLDNTTQCPHCGKYNGSKLDLTSLLYVMQLFFVNGTVHRTEYGGAPILQMNDCRAYEDIESISADLNDDCRLLYQMTGWCVFLYGPRLCMVGFNDILDDLRSDRINEAINVILSSYPVVIMDKSLDYYRLRLNPKNPDDVNEYDTPPATISRSSYGRLDSQDNNLIYLSSDLETCIHECRATVEDNIYVASLKVKKDLRLLDLTTYFDEKCTEFESVRLAVHQLFLASSHSYEISRQLANAIRDKGYDGVVYPSYFSHIRNGNDPFVDYYGGLSYFVYDEHYAEASQIRNYAIFGFPIQEGKLEVVSVNRIRIKQVKYDMILCPNIE